MAFCQRVTITSQYAGESSIIKHLRRVFSQAMRVEPRFVPRLALRVSGFRSESFFIVAEEMDLGLPILAAPLVHSVEREAKGTRFDPVRFRDCANARVQRLWFNRRVRFTLDWGLFGRAVFKRVDDHPRSTPFEVLGFGVDLGQEGIRDAEGD